MSERRGEGLSRPPGFAGRPSAGTVVVTGATGFIGSRVCAHLRNAGLNVRGTTTRAAAATPALHYINAADPRTVAQALHGAGIVLHLGGLAHVGDTRSEAAEEQFRRANVDMTAVLLEQAGAAGAARFVFLSSVKAMEEECDAALEETMTARPRDAYGRSKLQAEQLVLQADGARMRTTTLRIPLVYGEGMKANMLKLFKLVDRGVPLPLAGIRNRRSVIYAGNVVAALTLLAARPAAAGRVYLACDAAAISTPELVRSIASALGRPARLFPVPLSMLHTAAGVWSTVARRGAAQGAVRRLTGSLYLDTTRIRRELGFEAPFTLAEGMEHTAQWFIAHHRSA
jgi:nucleoside-diphosphate-sugar epimerase